MAALETPLYRTLKILEVMRAIFNNLLHERKCIHGSPLDYIDNKQTYESLVELAAFHRVANLLSYLCRNRSAHAMPTQIDRLLRVNGMDVLQDFNCLCDQSVLMQVSFILAVVVAVPSEIKC